MGSLPKFAVLILGVSTLEWGVSALREKVPCLEHGKFYRNPNRDPTKVWGSGECSKYYLCIEGEVYHFTCSTGLFFDVNKQICDFKNVVHNCDVTAEVTTPKPLYNTEEPICPQGETACADGTCLPTELFCDGHPDCYDQSDEGNINLCDGHPYHELWTDSHQPIINLFI